MRRAALLLLVALAGTSSVHTQSAAPATRPFVETLAAEKLGGREAGSPDERAAGDYIAAQLARLGARPLPGPSNSRQCQPRLRAATPNARYISCKVES